jgi:hypothetical protein
MSFSFAPTKEDILFCNIPNNSFSSDPFLHVESAVQPTTDVLVNEGAYVEEIN